MLRVFQRSFKVSHYYTITAAEVSLAVKTLNAAGCDEIRPEMLESLKQEAVHG